MADLAGEGWIEGNPSGTSALVNAGLRAGFTPRIDFPVREWTAKQGFVAAGLGLALVPALGASAARADIVLVPLAPTDAPVRTVYIATARHAGTAPAVTAFVPHLVAAARGLAR
jgi:DNA-binding transcriptional LysR family regulator